MVEFALSRSRSRRIALQHHPHGSRSAAPRRGGGDQAQPETLAPTQQTATVASGARWAGGYRARLRITDAAVIAAVVVAAYLARFGSAALESLATPTGSRFGSMALLVALAWWAGLAAFRTRDLRIIGVGAGEYKRVAHASTTTFGLLAIVFLVFQADTARWFFILAFPAGFFGLLLSRWLWRQWLTTQQRAGHALSRVIVIGKTSDVANVVAQIRAGSGAAYSVVGAVVEEEDPVGTAGVLGDVMVLAGMSRAAEFARTLAVDGVVVAGHPNGGSEYIHDLAWQLEGATADLILATSLANVAGPRIHFRPVEGLPLLHVEIPQFDGAKHVAKRAMDIVIAGTALLFLSPVFAVIALLIRLDSDGPSFFAQERVGRGGELFRILKFRSMNASAPTQLGALVAKSEGNGVLFKMKNDPRVTRLGRTLRKYSLDELPQLWNVLMGDMSLVGPRPPLASEVSTYEDHVHRRLYIKPGLTGMWQVNGRSNLSWEDSVRLDLYYVENWSLMGDLIILWRTVKVVAAPVGAY
ncbi:sugar transferase [Conyzicola nivalis]|uniref:Polyprenyl glycosylphosphotransferase n=1 Tax=Conyzicola nivalis TaxID=1477021 RepID=A0A916SPN4_9MICO|nr:sugar transferase [Conyzicola nivalis]GGB10234.1 polyprenyl glycosylphosphotransferase [Conyzicola nivalis]